MPTANLVTRTAEQVKAQLREVVCALFDEAWDELAAASSTRAIELSCWQLVAEIGRHAMATLLAWRCALASQRQCEELGLDAGKVTFRADYRGRLTTTFGVVLFPLFAFRVAKGQPTLVPGRDEVMPLSGKCRSSDLCVEWCALVATLHPFRKAESLLTYFTHGAVTLEDTTIERYALRVGNMITQEWCYLRRENLVQVLRERATCDALTGRAILYASCDAHALRRYAGSSWQADWKMVNGIRLWCVDRVDGSPIHVGGQFTSGDAKQVGKVVQALFDSDYLPPDGRFDDTLAVTYVVIVDGMPWIKDHVCSRFRDAVQILDAYHVMEKLSAYSKTRFACSYDAKEWYQRALFCLFGRLPRSKPKQSWKRRGHRKNRRRPRAPEPARFGSQRPSLAKLRDHIGPASNGPTKELLSYLANNEHRLDFASYRERGLQIGSGPMEAFHRTGSQDRMKRPGARWTVEALEALLRLRMLELSGRWTEWWSQPHGFAANTNHFRNVTYTTKRRCPQILGIR